MEEVPWLVFAITVSFAVSLDFGEREMLRGAPFEEYFIRLDVYFHENAVPDPSVLEPACIAQISGGNGIGDEDSRVILRDMELVNINIQPIYTVNFVNFFVM